MNRIGLIDVDGHSGFPNLALMKLSSWHKSIGDSVDLAMMKRERPVTGTNTFTTTRERRIKMSKFKKGDIVRITVKERQEYWNSAGKMDKYIGMLVVVDGVSQTDESFFVYDDTDGNRWCFQSEEAELVYSPSDRYEDGLNDAWEAAKRICLSTRDGGWPLEYLWKMFGTKSCRKVLMRRSPKEAIKILAAYKQDVKDEKARKELQDLIDRFGKDTIYAIVKDMAQENEKD